MFTTFRNVPGTDALRTSPFTIPESQNLALKPLHGGTFGYKYRSASLQLCLPSVCTHHMGYIKEVCIIQEVHWYWYSVNEFIYHPRKPKILLWNLLDEGTFGSEMDVGPLNYDFQVIAHITWDVYIYRTFASFRKCLGTDTSRTSLFLPPRKADTSGTSPFTNPESHKSCSEIPTQMYIWLQIETNATSIMFSKCLHTSRGIYERGVYHSGIALILILHERVHLLPQKA